MSEGARIPATRSNLLRLRRRLSQVEHGAALLRRKRESLVAELFRLAKPAVDGRRAIDRQSQVAWRALLEALATAGRPGLTALGWPGREVTVDLTAHEVWGLKGVEMAKPPSLVRSAVARGTVPGHGDAPAELAAREFERFVELLLEAAPKELLMRHLGEALARATRLVNTLEQRVAVEVGAELGAMRRTLEEREREERLRLLRVVRRRGAER